MRPKLSVLGLYQYDNTIFNDWQLPDGVVLSNLIDLVIAECSEMNTVFPNTDLFKQQIYTWSNRKLPIWTKLYATTTLEYNPIENYDRQETWTDSSSSEASSSNSDTTTSSATGFNSEALQTTGQDTGTASNSSNASNTATHTGRTHGNIGVTTSQQMIMSQREVDQFDIYDTILTDFIDYFCVHIY